MQEAFEANRQLASAEANFAAATAVVSAARAGLYPSTTAGFGGIYGRDATTDEILELEGQRPLTVWLFEDLFQVGYEVDLFGKVRRSIEAAHANAESAQAARDSLKVVVAAETARAFAQVCTFGEQLAVARHSHEVVAHEADITVNRHDAGAASDYDVARAQALEAQARSAIAPLEGQRRAALFQLTALLGRTPANAPHELDELRHAAHLERAHPHRRRRRHAEAPARRTPGRETTRRRHRPDRGRHRRSLSIHQIRRPVRRRRHHHR